MTKRDMNEGIYKSLALEISKDCLRKYYKCPFCITERRERKELVFHLIQVHKTEMLEGKIDNLKKETQIEHVIEKLDG